MSESALVSAFGRVEDARASDPARSCPKMGRRTCTFWIARLFAVAVVRDARPSAPWKHSALRRSALLLLLTWPAGRLALEGRALRLGNVIVIIFGATGAPHLAAWLLLLPREAGPFLAARLLHARERAAGEAQVGTGFAAGLLPAAPPFPAPRALPLSARLVAMFSLRSLATSAEGQTQPHPHAMDPKYPENISAPLTKVCYTDYTEKSKRPRE